MLAAIFPPLSNFMIVVVHSERTHTWAEAHVPGEKRNQAAFRVSLDIAWHRCGGAPQYFNAWMARYQGGPSHDPELLKCLEAFVGSESIGTPAAPGYDSHVEGLVAEHIWHLLTNENTLAFGPPVRVDGPGWSVTDPGGDGLAVYRRDDILVFRLWESKAHTGSGPVREVVNGACQQVDDKALRYLARYSKVGQSLPDPELQQFYGHLPEMWRTAAREAGGGISVSTASAAIEDSFQGFPAYWRFTHDDQRQGLVVTIDDYADFARLVREHLWKGL